MRAARPPGFYNVDLEILSRSKLNSLELAFGKVAHALHSGSLRRGVYLLSLECNLYPRNADAGILALCNAVQRLGKAERRLWDNALRRTFDVGYGLGPGVACVQVALKPESIRRIAELGAGVAFTCYQELAVRKLGERQV